MTQPSAAVFFRWTWTAYHSPLLANRSPLTVLPLAKKHLFVLWSSHPTGSNHRGPRPYFDEFTWPDWAFGAGHSQAGNR